MENKLELGDIVLMKKPHACGESKWEITRLGVDIKLKCTCCNHEIIMDRIELYKKIKRKVSGRNEKS